MASSKTTPAVSQSLCRATLISLAALLFLGPVAPQVNAQTERDWISAGGGAWMDDENWADDTIPGAGERAVFDLDQDPAYAVTLGTSTSIGSLQIKDDQISLSIAPTETLALTEPHTGDGDNSNNFTDQTALMIGRGTSSVDEHGEMTVSSGTFTVEGMILGGTSNSSGSLHVTGANTIFNNLADGLGGGTIGYLGDATFRLSDGATANFDQFAFGRHAAANATVIVEGADTVLNYNRGRVAWRGTSLLEVRDGAHIEGGAMDISVRDRAGTMIVDNATATINSRIEMGTHQSTGTLRVLNGGEMTVTSYIRAGMNASGTTVGVGVIEVDGTGSSLSVGSYIALGGFLNTDNDGIGSLTVSGGGAVDIGTTLRVWTQGTVAVDGGTITAQDWLASPDSVLALTLHTGSFAAPITLGDPFLTPGNATISDSVFQLSLAPGFTANLEDVFGVMAYSGDLTGMFAGLDEGDILAVGGYEFQINYGDGTDDLITLTVIPEPASGLLFLLGAMALFGCRFRRRLCVFE